MGISLLRKDVIPLAPDGEDSAYPSVILECIPQYFLHQTELPCQFVCKKLTPEMDCLGKDLLVSLTRTHLHADFEVREIECPVGFFEAPKTDMQCLSVDV